MLKTKRPGIFLEKESSDQGQGEAKGRACPYFQMKVKVLKNVLRTSAEDWPSTGCALNQTSPAFLGLV